MSARKLTAIRIDEDIERQAKEVAKAYRRSFSNFIEYLLFEEIAKFNGMNTKNDNLIKNDK